MFFFLEKEKKEKKKKVGKKRKKATKQNCLRATKTTMDMIIQGAVSITVLTALIYLSYRNILFLCFIHVGVVGQHAEKNNLKVFIVNPAKNMEIKQSTKTKSKI